MRPSCHRLATTQSLASAAKGRPARQMSALGLQRIFQRIRPMSALLPVADPHRRSPTVSLSVPLTRLRFSRVLPFRAKNRLRISGLPQTAVVTSSAPAYPISQNAPVPMRFSAADINLEIVYGAAATTDSAAQNAASAFVKFMAAPENRSVWKEAGFEPPANLNSN
jgi:Bacterial extracellular solute-binding protein